MKLETRNLKLGTAGLLVLLFPLFGNAVEGFKLVCDKPVYNFGTVDQSAVVTNVFTVRNEGDLTFALKYIHPGCSCTKAKIDKRMIGPGETAEVTAVFTAKKRRGGQKKSLRIISINSTTPALTLYMKGFVSAPAR